jgi:PhnB protein
MALANAAPSPYHNVQPYLMVPDSKAAIEFYVRIFGATERMRMPSPSGGIMHAELHFGDTVVMLADESPAMDAWAPAHFGGSPVAMMLYVSDVDQTYRDALAAGATSRREPADQFYGDRSADIVDPFGHRWHMATRVREVSSEEMNEALAKMGAPSAELATS